MRYMFFAVVTALLVGPEVASAANPQGVSPTMAEAAVQHDTGQAQSERAVDATKPVCPLVPRYYPEKARRMNVNGKAILDCRIEATGTPSDCQVVSETPPGLGFGHSALCMAPLFKFSTVDESGASRVGKRITVPLTFKIPDH
jgi:TonB family protein